MRQDGFQNRYIIKITSSIAITLLNMVIQLLLPRSFTVEEYGYYSYNLNVFTSIVVLANLASSNALISKFAKRNIEIGLIYYYLKFYIIEVLAISSGVVLLFHFGFVQNIFFGQSITMVLLGLESSLILKFQNDVIGLYDAMAVSRVPAVLLIILKTAMAIFTVIAYILGILDINRFYFGQLVITLTVVCVMLILIIKFQRNLYHEKVDKGWKAYSAEFYEFCRPLVISSVVAQLMIIIMNLSLMKWAGVVEQALFGAAWQLNTLVSYVFSPYAELSKREYAVVASDKKQICLLYEKSMKLMMWITAYFSLFIGFCADWILPVIYGEKYHGAELITLLVMVYTIYQAWGQINGSLMLATERTKINAVIAIISQIITFILVFLFQIPNFIWSDGLGAVGLALVYAIGNILSVLIGVIWISRSIGISCIKILRIQIFPIFICSLSAYCLNNSLEIIWDASTLGGYIINIVIAGVIYSLIIGGILWKKPELIGGSREGMRSVFHI